MRSVLALVLILLVAPVAAARAETDPSEKEPVAAIAQTLVEEPAAPAQPELVVGEVEIPSRAEAAAETPAAQDMPRRGSFWWMVGVIVVAGVILYVLVGD
jgi:hypothetical protein